MTIIKVWVEEDCKTWGLCQDICPEVFLIKDISTVIEGINLAEYEAKIKEAADSCPLEAIKYIEE